MKRIFLIFIIAMIISFNNLNAQWIQRSTGSNTQFTDVVMLDTATAIAVGRDRSIFRTTNSGITWLDAAAPLSYAEPWNSISFFDKENGAVVGDHRSILTTTNGGINWRWHSIPADEKCLSVLQIGPGNIYVGTDSGSVYHSVDTGKTWMSEKISKWPIRSLYPWRGTYVMGLPIYALTPYSLCSKLEFPPTAWNEKILESFKGLGSEAFDGEFCYGGGAGFIAGVHGDWISLPALLRKTFTDTVWQFIPTNVIGTGIFLGVSAPSANVIYVCGSNGTIIKSTSGGDNWTSINSPVLQNINAIYFYDEKHGFAVGDEGTILFTSNGVITNIKSGKDNLPGNFSLSQNYPNPFNPSTKINYQIPKAGHVSLKVYDLLGEEITTLVDEFKPAGTYSDEFRVQNSELPSGVYFYRIASGNFIETKKLVLLK